MSQSFKETYIIRLALGGISSFCGVSVGTDILGNARWAKSVTASNNISRILALSTDSSGNIYAAGLVVGNSPFQFSENVQLTGSSVLGNNAYLIKYNSSGEVLWSKTVTSGTNGSLFNSIVIDGTGNIFAAGTIEATGTYSFGNGVSVNGTNLENLLIVKFNSEGIAQWAKSVLSGSNSTNFSSLALDRNGNIYASGYLAGSGTYTFGNNVSVAATYSGFNALLIKYDTSGNALWVKTAQSGNDESVFNSVSTDPSGNVYVAGRISGSQVFDFGAGITTSGKFSNQNAVIVKFNSIGDALWARAVIEEGDRSTFNSIAIDLFGNVYAGGIIKGRGLFSYGNGVSVNGSSDVNNTSVVKYDTNGNVMWARTVSSGTGVSIINQLILDSRSNIYAVGDISGSIPFSFGEGINVNGTSDDANLLLVRYNANGNPQWARSVYSGINASRYWAAAVDGFGNLYSAGSIFGNEIRSFNNGVMTSGAFSTGTNSVLVQYR